MKPTPQNTKRQAPGTFDVLVGTNSNLLFKIKQYPVLYIALSWIAYTSLDILTRKLLGREFRLLIPSVNLIFALLVSPVIFYGIYSGLRDIKHNPQKLLWGIICLLVLLIWKIAADVTLVPEYSPPLHRWIYGSLRVVSCMLFVFPVWGMTLVAEKYEQQLIAQLEAQKLELENRTLKYHPHLFLNILNDISGKAVGISKPLFNDLVHLNNFFSYAFNDEKDKNSLIVQLDVIKSFLHCQNLRFAHSIFLDYSVVIEPSLLTKSIFFPENGLIDLVHNMYIHGDLSDSSIPGHLQIKLLADRRLDLPVLSFQSENRIKMDNSTGSRGFGNKTTREYVTRIFPSSDWVESIQHNVYKLEITIIFESYD
ncbi:sensor histidine kinase [Algoriphagus sp. NG3]|uniref:sensor histidine kinase n=1 Tax=Algoriphagus sp. NG3 TaxID=3097546 RepID=UPI002A819D14|nr:histidine kinase [Algoriphagus sp. NG3]WPR77495.1 histidine kinase [Algoriphagus sp. NG3]